MKYVLAGLAIIAAVAALFFRPPNGPVTSARADSPATKASLPRPNAGGARTAVPPRMLVYVAGEVMKPGVYRLAPGERAQDALARAGGPKPDADLVAVNLAAPLNDGEEIAVPKVGAEPPRSRRAVGPRPHGSHVPRRHGRLRRATPATPAQQSVDLNTAGESDLETLPGIGPGLAARIVAYRETNGPFTSVDELADISGITPRIQDELANMVFVR